MCNFTRALLGPCDQDSLPDSDMCAHHATLLCCSCGESATRTCDAPGEKKVCGCFLCATCEHRPLPNGRCGFPYQHARPGEELHFPHYAKDIAALAK